jgi:hypothetical protein
MKPSVAVVVVSVLLGTAPVAHADENAYYSELAQKIDTPLTNTHAMYLAMIACNAIRAGVSAGLPTDQARAKADSAVEWAQNDLGIGLSQSDDTTLVNAAEDQIC